MFNTAHTLASPLRGYQRVYPYLSLEYLISQVTAADSIILPTVDLPCRLTEHDYET